MADVGTDEEVRREIWAGHVPIRLVLSSDEVSTLEPPLPFYVMAPRNSYLPLVLTQARGHFQSSVPVMASEADLWLEYEGIPLKWHLPTGMLYDMLAKAIDLPWNLTVHFQGFPQSVAMRLLNEEAMRSRFFHTMKEATCIRCGGTKRVNSLSVADTNQLWEAVKNHEYEAFWRVNNKILFGGPGDNTETRNIPIRVHVSGVVNQYQTSHPVGDGKATLGVMLNALLPDLFPSAKVQEGEGPEVVIQGVRPPLW
eukprot:CAMPEP_0114547870 /NCGR_PEP_ID=MMETSP0114-20121206/4685_1 /TAXON_ID=31324 /ORGANISM="Goniomonas sp, Strain m" /LENGTH=253 /DNA_ID=CAMNT_0001732435 /DNA_START=14 /DNA_END=772 /DNA_ORIENTATION=+